MTAFESQAMVLEDTRKQRADLLKNLAQMKRKVNQYVKEMDKMEFKELGAGKKRHMDMSINLIKLTLQIVDAELKVINSSVDSEIAYKTLMVEVLKLKEALNEEAKANIVIERPKEHPYSTTKSR